MIQPKRTLAWEIIEMVGAACWYTAVVFTSMCILASCISGDGTYSFESEIGGSYWVEDPYLPDDDFAFSQYESPDRLDLPQQVGCSELDLLFVVDNSGSMKDEQTRMLAAVPGFVAQLRSFGVGFDLHLGVTTTDRYLYNPTECRELGSLVTRTSSDVCGPYLEGNYMTHDDDLDFTFPCAFRVGTTGSGYEEVAGALVEAIKPSLLQATDPWGFRADECNVGFHRPDAGLVAVILTDEPDTFSWGTPLQWSDALYYLHRGEIFLVGFLPQQGCGLYAETDQVTGLNRLMDMVPSYEASICAEDYAAEFSAAVRDIVTECAAVSPEG